MIRRRCIVALAVLTLVAASCGTGTDDAGTDDAATTTAPGDETTATTAPDTEDPGTTAPPSVESQSVAVITLADGREYEYTDTGFVTDRCQPNAFGTFMFTLTMPDENGETLIENGRNSVANGALIPEGVDTDATSEIMFSVAAEDIQWEADEGVAGSGITEFTIDGDVASGTATFVSSTGETVPGTFTIRCMSN